MDEIDLKEKLVLRKLAKKDEAHRKKLLELANKKPDDLKQVELKKRGKEC